MSANPLTFLVASSSRARRALAAGTLGWMLDGMDVTLYAMVLRELLRELQLSTAQAGLLASVTLVASAAGGVVFGFLADRWGRRTALMVSIVAYSLFTAACGLSHSLWQLAVLRLGVGLGMGGEWATGAALVSETWPDQHRGKALGLMQSGFAVGYALAAIIAAIVMPRFGWRPVFYAGILPAFLTLWIGARVEESPLWLAERASRGGVRVTGYATRNTRFGIRDTGLGAGDAGDGVRNSEFDGEDRAPSAPNTVRPVPSPAKQPPFPRPNAPSPDSETSLAGFRPPCSVSRVPRPESRIPYPVSRELAAYAKPILITLLMNSAALFGWWGLFTWIPSYLALPVARGGRGLSLAASSAWIIAMEAGMWLGYVTFGYASDALGRKRTYVFYLLMAALLVPIYARAQPLTLLLAGPLLAFFGSGHFTGFGIITAELFPTSFRASAMGLTYNFGRALSAAAPWAIGALAARSGLAAAFEISALAFLLAAVLALGLPETRGRSLS